MTKSFHLHIDIQNILDLSEEEFNADYKNVFCDVFGKGLPQDKVRENLERELLLGRKKLSMGECNNFDFETGCLGHSEVYVENPEEIRKCLKALYDACMAADAMGELSEFIHGSLLNKCGKALGIQKEEAKG